MAPQQLAMMGWGGVGQGEGESPVSLIPLRSRRSEM